MLPHLLFGNVSDMMFLLGKIKTNEVGACLDTGHARLSGDLDGVFHKLSSHLQLVHISDHLDDWDAHLLPGEGSIEWLWVVDQPDRHQFVGELILEMASREKDSVAVTLARVSRGRDFLASVLEAQSPHLSLLPDQP